MTEPLSQFDFTNAVSRLVEGAPKGLPRETMLRVLAYTVGSVAADEELLKKAGGARSSQDNNSDKLVSIIKTEPINKPGLVQVAETETIGPVSLDKAVEKAYMERNKAIQPDETVHRGLKVPAPEPIEYSQETLDTLQMNIIPALKSIVPNLTVEQLEKLSIALATMSNGIPYRDGAILIKPGDAEYLPNILAGVENISRGDYPSH